jgi:hypothetical protein
LGLLEKANAEAVRMLGHDLREAAQARDMMGPESEPPSLPRALKYRHQLTNIAACLAILLLTKSGLFNSLDRFSTGGAAFVRQYYASQVGEELAREVFDT